jgi:hypothetical protein
LPKQELLSLEELDRLCSACVARATGAAEHHDPVPWAVAPSRLGCAR